MASARPARRYGFSCLVCRRKKIRCDGEKPRCSNCIGASDDCAYKATDALVADLYARLHESNARVKELEDSLRRLPLIENDNLGRVQDPVGQMQTGPAGLSPIGVAGSVETAFQSSIDKASLHPEELTVDKDGELSHFGATSRFHSQEQPPTHDEAPHTLQAQERYHKKWLLSQSRFYSSWESLASETLRRDPEIGFETATTLMKMYWTWQGPLHNCVYRPCFYRDMAMNGPYFSPFLLNVIFAHASRHVKPDDSRFTKFERGEYFLAKAKLLLLDELGLEKPRVPTIQGLLILGGRQCAVGNSSEGWLYTGMAIRMIKDMGLHIKKKYDAMLGKLEPDDLEALKRLYLSAYSWDKSISLCLGRAPSLTELPYHPDSILDFAGDDDIWRPFYLAEIEDQYPGVNANTSLTFSWFCRLCMLINDLYHTIYNGRLNQLEVQRITNLEERLRAFYTSLPEVLRINDVASLPFCPPPHILCLNILYHTVLILLFRPFCAWASSATPHQHAMALRARKVCVEEAALVNSFFQAYGKTFNYQNQTYLISYCVYTAATIELHQITESSEVGESEAARRLATTVEMLEMEVRQTPGIRRSIDIIRSRLEACEKTNLASQSWVDSGEYQGRNHDFGPPRTEEEAESTGVGHVQWTDWVNMNPGGDFVPDIEGWAWDTEHLRTL